MVAHPTLEPSDTNPQWHELQAQFDAVASLARQDVAAEVFYAELIQQLVDAIGAIGGAYLQWRGTAPRLVTSFRLDEDLVAALQTDGSSIEQLRAVAQSGAVHIVPPRSAGGTGHSAAHDLLLSPVAVDGRSTGLLIIQQDEKGELSSAEVQLRIATAFTALAEDYERSQELRALRDQAQDHQRLEALLEQLHGRLDLAATAFSLANEGRLWIGCDRLSVLQCKAGHCVPACVSGIDRIDQRSGFARSIAGLGAAVASGGEPLRYQDHATDLPPQLEAALTSYLELSPARCLVAWPLQDPSEEHAGRATIAVLIAERFDADMDSHELQRRLGTLAHPGALALNNALQYHRLPALVRTADRWTRGWNGHRRAKTIVCLLLLIAAGLSLALVPAPFDIEAEGELMPGSRQHVFAPSDGVVSRLLVQHGDVVEAGRLLLEMRLSELDLDVESVAGDMQTAQRQLASVQAKRRSTATDEDYQLAAEEQRLGQQLIGLKRQLEVLDDKRQSLQVLSPMAGRVLTWDLENRLEARPVQRGQRLLSVADTDGAWVVEVKVLDRDIGHVLTAQHELQPDLNVSFVVGTEPTHRYTGRILNVALATNVEPGRSPFVFVTVATDLAEAAGRRPGAQVSAKIHCGRRSLGYVWLRDLIDMIYTRVLF